MKTNKIIFSCLFATLLVGPIGQNVNTAYGASSKEHKASGGGHAAARSSGSGGSRAASGGSGHAASRASGAGPAAVRSSGGQTGARQDGRTWSGGRHDGGRGWNRGSYYNRGGVGIGIGVGPSYYGDSYYEENPEDYSEVAQESETCVEPGEIDSMRSYVSNAMGDVKSASVRKGLIGTNNTVRDLGNQFNSEYNIYLKMVQSNDPNVSSQECKLKDIFQKFQSVYGGSVSQ